MEKVIGKISNKEVIIETGQYAKQANGSVIQVIRSSNVKSKRIKVKKQSNRKIPAPQK